MLDTYLDYLNEGYLFSDKTISINLDRFERGQSNKLLIVGLLGSGKTTLGEYLLKQYKVKEFVSDVGMDRMLKSLKNPNTRTIIEGAQIAWMYKDKPEHRELILSCPMILIGMSAIKAGLRADRRDGTTPMNAKNKKDIYYFIRKNISEWQKYITYFRKDALKIPNAKIEEYKIPKFKPVIGI